MYIDVLIAEIGSTVTKVNAFSLKDAEPRFLGQGSAPTTVSSGDVREGLKNAVEALRIKLVAGSLDYGEMFATSSAAGGLRMSVHGLVYDMTVRAAETAALGAGAVIRMVTAGKMNGADLEELKALHPNLILIAGGTDYGDRETALFNAEAIAELKMTDVPVIYAGNIQNRNLIGTLFEKQGISAYITENVYPKLDDLNIEPCRKIIQEVFEKHIVAAPGMEHIRDMVNGPIMTTPGAVMEAARRLYEEIGDLIAVDIGGATTDVHSLTEGSVEIAHIQTRPEPFAKRTVEGDLGLFVNAPNLIRKIGEEELGRELGLDIQAVTAHYMPIPDTIEQFKLTERLCLEAGTVATERHAGKLRYVYMPEGRRTLAEGKDLTQVKHLVATGGALTQLPHRKEILRQIADINKNRMLLYPAAGSMDILIDRDYIMASVGVLSKKYPAEAMTLMKKSLEGD